MNCFTCNNLRAGLAALTLLFATGATARADSPGDTTLSAFYAAPATLPDAPGRMLRSEALPPALHLGQAGQQLRILYSSTDGVSGHGIVAVSGAIFLPRGEPPKGGWKVVAWAHGTVGIADACAPSWSGRSQRDIDYLNAWLSQGYAIVATDYQGLGTAGTHPYIQTRPAAYSVLDAVRAALAAPLHLANDVVVIGQSQGGGAAFATGAFQPQYAPDLHLRGVVATGTPYISPHSIKGALAADPDHVDPTIAYLLYLLETAQDPTLAQSAIAPDAQAIAAQTAKVCLHATEQAIETNRLTRRKAFDPKAMAAALPSLLPPLEYPTLKLAMPVFLGTGGKDHDVPTPGQILLAKDACAAGSDVVFHLYPAQDHSGTVMTSLPDSTPFVRAVLAGERPASNCATLPQ